MDISSTIKDRIFAGRITRPDGIRNQAPNHSHTKKRNTLNNDSSNPNTAAIETIINSSKDLQERQKDDHAFGLPFLAVYHDRKLFSSSRFSRLNQMERTEERVYGAPRSDLSQTSIYFSLPGNESLTRFGTYEKLSTNVTDLCFFEDLSGGSYEERKTQIGPLVQAVTLACATLAYQFGWLLPKNDALANMTLNHIAPENKAYGFAFAMQHAVYKHRADIVKYCVDQGGDPLCSQRAELEVHTTSALEAAFEDKNHALANLILQSLSPEKDADRILNLFSEEHGWTEIPKLIQDFLPARRLQRDHPYGLQQKTR
jgi:hypothetical protein